MRLQDLVKTHLMYAVHEEVEQLRQRLSDLEREYRRLKDENRALREHASAETLSLIEDMRLNASTPVTLTPQQSVVESGSGTEESQSSGSQPQRQRSATAIPTTTATAGAAGQSTNAAEAPQ